MLSEFNIEKQRYDCNETVIVLLLNFEYYD